MSITELETAIEQHMQARYKAQDAQDNETAMFHYKQETELRKALYAAKVKKGAPAPSIVPNSIKLHWS